MYNLVPVVFGTAIPISLYIFSKCCQYFIYSFGIRTKDVVLANIFQVLANKSANTQFQFPATDQGQGGEPLQKVPDLTNT